MERHRQHQNWYADVDTQAGDDLTDEPLVGLAASTSTSCDDDERLVPPPPDAGVEPGPSSAGCGCRATSSARGSLAALWSLVVVALARRRARRRVA